MNPRRASASLQAGLFLVVLAAYLLAGSREELWGDPKAAFVVAENWVNYDKIDIGYAWPVSSAASPDGKYYSPYSALPSIVQLPAAKLDKRMREHKQHLLPLWRPIGFHFASALAGALTVLLFFRLCLRLGVSPGIASVTSGVLGFCTLVFPYARDPFSEMLQTLCFTGLAASLWEVGRGPEKRHAVWLGVYAGLLINCKQIFVLAIAGAALYLLATLRREPRRLLVTTAVGAAAFAPFAALALGYNYMRWGAFTDPGLGTNAPLFTERMLYGVLGFLASPGKSLFLFSPPLVAALFGLPLLWRRHRAAALAFGATVIPVVLAYAKYVMWNGDQSWGPRYLLFLHPLAMVPLALLLEAGLRRWQKIAVGALVVVGFAVQIVGSALWRGHWMRIAMEVNTQWLGNPNTKGSHPMPCMACFEHHYGTVWLPPLQAIDGTVWLLLHIAAGDDFATAEEDAPWRRYTSLHLDVGAHYDRARIDWWGLIFLKDKPELRTPGLIVLGFELGLLGAGIVLFRRGARKSRAPA